MATAPVGGLSQQFWVKPETTYDTVLAMAATDAVDLIDLKIEPTLEYSKRQSHVGTSSLQGEIQEKRGGQWSFESYVSPNGAGVAPDIGEVLKHALGDETVVGGTSVTYEPLDTSPTAGLQIWKYATENFAESANGAWVENLTIETAGGEEAKISGSGGFASYGMVLQQAQVLGIEPIAETAIVLEAGDAAKIRPGLYVKFDTEDNGGDGYLVTAVDYDTDTITISPGLAGATEANDAVWPVVPSQTIAGSPQGGIAGSLSIGGTSMGLIKATINISTGIKGLDAEGSANRANRLLRDGREISGELELYYLDESTAKTGLAWNDTTQAVIVRVGPDTTEKRMLITMPACRLSVYPTEFGDEEAATITVAFMARQSAAAKDEIDIAFT